MPMKWEVDSYVFFAYESFAHHGLSDLSFLSEMLRKEHFLSLVTTELLPMSSDILPIQFRCMVSR